MPCASRPKFLSNAIGGRLAERESPIANSKAPPAGSVKQMRRPTWNDETANVHGGRLRAAESPWTIKQSATGRLHEVESVAPINKEAGRHGLAHLIFVLGMRTIAAPRMPTLRLVPGPYVRSLSYECGSLLSDP
ncbi:protein of unknown function [Hyphomicrobium sp. MC1]|nr:protein of unknown function [Hyphomicrobium sp. MC1]